ncbi:protein-tyrosine phosphatase-like protein [Lineolata rhizophorae]|uniref:Protein-tyrosine phosphatase-like protein n=1 Tax=Lineolata rhizophorae TaxID=578093 RepID=A0A6A6P799_9PEZI|nr:protein-tyrosine phosphatase-like protein [Lineolata rhizophorae]
MGLNSPPCFSQLMHADLPIFPAMQPLKEPKMDAIQDAPGLYISDRVAARSVKFLKQYNIRYILSAVGADDAPKVQEVKFSDADGEWEISRKIVEIDDDPTQDMMRHLKDACDWIDAGLGEKRNDAENEQRQRGVLVHCVQGISRSGSIVVAYLMRKLKIEYSAALALAREARPIIFPNQGFERQLRIWHFCKFDIYQESTPGSPNSPPKAKQPYRVWKSERDNLLSRGQEAANRLRHSSMAEVAAAMGKRRLKKKEEAEASKRDGRAETSQAMESQKEWERVDAMEKEWNKKLIFGEVADEQNEDSK